MNKPIYFRCNSPKLLLLHFFPISRRSLALRDNYSMIQSIPSNSSKMTSLDTTVEESPIAPLLSVPSTRLRSLILKKHLTTFNTQLTKEKRADPHLTRLILLNVFQIFQVTKINFGQYLKLHKHPDTYITQCDATTQTEYSTIRPKPFSRTLSNRSCTELEKQNLTSYWPSDECDTTDDELQKTP